MQYVTQEISAEIKKADASREQAENESCKRSTSSCVLDPHFTSNDSPRIVAATCGRFEWPTTGHRETISNRVARGDLLLLGTACTLSEVWAKGGHDRRVGGKPGLRAFESQSLLPPNLALGQI